MNHSNTMNEPPKHATFNNELIEFDCTIKFATSTLLNCYIREVTLSNDNYQIIEKENKYFLNLVIFNQQLEIEIKRPSIANYFIFISMPSIKTSQKTLTFDDLIYLINADLASKHHTLLNFELIEQAKNSIRNINFFIQYKQLNPSKNTFLQSEQGLLFGHEFHPAPKARFGVSLKELNAISPEVSAKFKLTYFKVPKNALKTYQSSTNLNLPNAIKETDDAILYPLHPYQAEQILNNSHMMSILKQHNIQPIGSLGDYFYPTSSVRTLFSPQEHYFYKFSLHIRLTNCLRKNAFYELENAIEINKILNKIKHQNHHAIILGEPQAFTVDIDTDLEMKHQIQEYFGLIIRDNINQQDYQSTYLALSLFSYRENQAASIVNLIKSMSNQNYQHNTLLWFNNYAKYLIEFCFDYYFKHGVVFEPHLQNILIKLDDKNLPNAIYIRDLEGSKLSQQFWDKNQFSYLSQNGKDALFYTEKQSWNRLIYCLIINNLASAIHYLSNHSYQLECQLYRALKDILKHYQASNKNNRYLSEKIQQLLINPYLPYKANLRTRFLKTADKNAQYVNFDNPFLKV
ncbi:MAG: hypothetical protein EP298_05640 [Gammaproteobacteria bacterium]|nr:MAG: hypothetical protein EP298_05640 [Gammaproteobacteria bacterium]UTW42757.1 hypothetical protein KFE69_01005 [bacterium SCSIO 12844]